MHATPTLSNVHESRQGLQPMLLVEVQMEVDAAGSVAMAGPEEMEAGMEKRVEGLVTTGGWGAEAAEQISG